MADAPRVGTEDRSKWVYSEAGPPFTAAWEFVDLLRQPDVDRRLEQVRERVTAQSWAAWERSIRAGLDPHWLLELSHFSQTVRHPASGMAYVFCVVLHPDQNEEILVTQPQPMFMHVVTLLEQEGRWLVHQIGPMVPPADLGRQAYSW
jgi:hypothetical protein